MKFPLSLCLMISLVALGVAPLAGGDLSSAKPEDAGFSSERLERVDAMLEGYIERQEIAGAVGLIARRGKIVYHKSFGEREVETGAPMEKDAIFRIASMTKPIASAALMMLWEQGAFQLRDPVSKFLPEFADMQVATIPGAEDIRGPMKLTAATRPITIQHLLTHTAGLANSYRGVTQPLYGELRGKRQPNWTIGDYVKELAKLPLSFEPGERWEYGPATDVVGRLV